MNMRSIVVMLRPLQWLKNLMVYFPVFLSGSLLHSRHLASITLPFVAFCLASSATYIVNDFLDIEQDARHPQKKLRPLPAGDVSNNSALTLAALMFIASVLLALQVSLTFFLYLVLYLVISSAYSIRLKHLPIYDVFCISFGFVLRLYGGGAAFGVYISDWLFLTVFLMSIFLSAGKRYSEQRSLGELAGSHRRSLGEYPEGFLDAAMNISGASVLVTYSLYVINRPHLVYTVPLCMFGLLRYLLLIKSGGEGDPTHALIKDLSLMVIGVIWVFMVALSVYL